MNVSNGLRAGLLASLAVAALLAAGAARAQANSGVEITTAGFKEVQVTAPDGSVSVEREPVARVIPGDTVAYEIAYANHGDETATDLVINNAVPAEVTFVESVNPPSEVSVDGGANFGALGDLTVEEADGSVRPARPSDITNLRWNIPSLAPGDDGKVVYRVRVK